MSRPPISYVNLNPHLSLSERHPFYDCRTNSWWLYDKRAGSNIGMQAKTRDDAFVEGIEYWADRALRAERCYSDIRSQVDAFVTQFVEPEDQDQDEE